MEFMQNTAIIFPNNSNFSFSSVYCYVFVLLFNHFFSFLEKSIMCATRRSLCMGSSQYVFHMKHMRRMEIFIIFLISDFLLFFLLFQERRIFSSKYTLTSKNFLALWSWKPPRVVVVMKLSRRSCIIRRKKKIKTLTVLVLGAPRYQSRRHIIEN